MRRFTTFHVVGLSSDSSAIARRATAKALAKLDHYPYFLR
jgi:hypothetical protein